MRAEDRDELAGLWDRYGREVWTPELVEVVSDLRIVLAVKLADAAALARDVARSLKDNDALGLVVPGEMARGRFAEDVAAAQAALVRALGEVRAVRLPTAKKVVAPCVLVPWFAEALAKSG